MIRPGRVAAAAATIAIALAGLTGCASEKKDDMLNLAEAKTLTQTVELEIGSFVPAELVTFTEQHEESSVLFDCENGYVWPGLLRLELAEGVDQDAVGEAIAANWRDKPEWTVEEKVSKSGSPIIAITGTDGSFFSATFRKEGREFRVKSFSPCFDLGGKVDPGKIY